MITDTLHHHSLHSPEKPAILSGNHTITYRELYVQVTKVASYLLEYKRIHPAEKEYKLALLMKNRVEFLYYFLGAAMSGWIAVPLDIKWSKKELEGSLGDCEPQLLVIEEPFSDRLPDSTKGTNVIIINNSSITLPTDPVIDGPGHPEISGEQLFYMGFTSGTTGKPKGFVRTHHSWVKSFEGSQVEFGILSEEWIFAPGPLVHSTFLYAAVHGLYIGATVVLLDKFSPKKVMDHITRYPISVVYMVPTMFESLAVEMDANQLKIEENRVRMILSAGAKWSPESKQKVSCWFPYAQLFEFYGASELSFITVMGPDGNKRKPESVGRPFDQVRLSIRDEEGREVPTGEIGKLFVQSPFVFAGYYRNEEETKTVLQEGWATVHDLAWQDEEGYIFLVGREKNMLICGGLNVYPEEIEKVIKRLPEIEEAVVLGEPDPYWGDKIMAVVRFKDGMNLRLRDIQTYCRKELAGYKCPREIYEVKEIPYTTSGKVARRMLQDCLASKGSEVIR